MPTADLLMCACVLRICRQLFRLRIEGVVIPEDQGLILIEIVIAVFQGFKVVWFKDDKFLEVQL